MNRSPFYLIFIDCNYSEQKKVSHGYHSGGQRIFPRGHQPWSGAPTYYFTNFSQKLHENEDILDVAPLDPPMDVSFSSSKEQIWENYQYCQDFRHMVYLPTSTANNLYPTTFLSQLQHEYCVVKEWLNKNWNILCHITKRNNWLFLTRCFSAILLAMLRTRFPSSITNMFTKPAC